MSAAAYSKPVSATHSHCPAVTHEKVGSKAGDHNKGVGEAACRGAPPPAEPSASFQTPVHSPQAVGAWPVRAVPKARTCRGKNLAPAARGWPFGWGGVADRHASNPAFGAGGGSASVVQACVLLSLGSSAARLQVSEGSWHTGL